ncbi:MAG: efflux RND transporter periplasmic adaptor subunit [Bacteroidetes bacterium]|nr:MAG: efflux RND transporter periplasmic adaptor subunit [Bacteroidota bacterium]TAG87099.1 MAG: efflux RND transporter periplasmic adaptor subunit [Bacteroidota bacterium]
MDTIRPKKYWTQKRIITWGFSIIAVAFFSYSFILTDSRSKLNIEKEKINITTVKEGVFDEYIVVQCVAQPLKTIRLDAIVGGYVTKKMVEGGDMVKQGDVLLVLENQSLKLSFLQSETEANRLVNDLQNTRQRLKTDKFTLQKNISELDFQLAQAKENFERNQQLWNGKAISEAEYLKAKRDYEKLIKQKEIEFASQKYQEENSIIQIGQLEGTLDRTQRNVGVWRENLDNLAVKAPISGLLSSIDVEIGANITQGQNIAQIDDVSGFKLRGEIEEHYVSRIFVGLKGTTTFNDKKYTLNVSKVYPEIKNGRFRIDMLFEENKPDELKRGLTLPIYLELGKSNKGILLPVGGFFAETGGNWVYVLDESGTKATKRNISLGRKNAEFYEVLSGLKSGDKVITSSYSAFGNKDVLQLK